MNGQGRAEPPAPEQEKVNLASLIKKLSRTQYPCFMEQPGEV